MNINFYSRSKYTYNQLKNHLEKISIIKFVRTKMFEEFDMLKKYNNTNTYFLRMK